MLKSAWSTDTQLAQSADEAEQLRLRSTILVAFTLIVSTLAWFWGFLYIYYGEVVAGLIPITYSLLSYIGLIYYRIRGSFTVLVVVQLFVGMVLPFTLMLVLGGFVGSSGVILWSFTSVVGAMLFTGRRESWAWFAAFVFVVVAGALLNNTAVRPNNLPNWLITLFFALNILGVTGTVFVLMNYFVAQRDRAFSLLSIEQDKSERLLLNVLPASVAATLKEGQQTIAEHFDEVSILFADIVGYTPLSATVNAGDLVEMLNEIYSEWDLIMARFGPEKIRTMGDAYMAASGVPVPRADHAHVLVDAALEMMAFMNTWESAYRERVHFRVGINSGPVTAGIIGRQKFSYDVWGDPVNIASRMETQGESGRIQVGPATYELIRDDFVCIPRGVISVKGKGEMETWFVESRITPAVN